LAPIVKRIISYLELKVLVLGPSSKRVHDHAQRHGAHDHGAGHGASSLADMAFLPSNNLKSQVIVLWIGGREQRWGLGNVATLGRIVVVVKTVGIAKRIKLSVHSTLHSA
jgi:hypothetical protein